MPGGMLMGVDAAAAAGGAEQSVYSLSFDGTGRVDITAVNLGTTQSLSFWVNKSDSADAIPIAEAAGLGYGYLDSTNIYFRASSTGEVHVAHGGLGVGSWVHWGVVRVGTSVSFYKNGSQIGTTQTMSANNSFSPNTIGARGGGSVYINGLMDDVAFFKSDQSANMAGLASGATDPSTLTPAGIWRFEEGSGSSAADTSGNGDTGSLVGGVTWSTDVPSQLT